MTEKFLNIDGLGYFKSKQDDSNEAKFALTTDIPTKVSELANDSGYQTATQVSAAIGEKVANAYIYKGSVATVAALPSTGNITGDVYNVQSSGMNYAWAGTGWDSLGSTEAVTWDSIQGKPLSFIPSDHGHESATQTTDGFLSNVDKAKLDGIQANANNYSLPTASSSTLGGVKVGENLTIANGVLSGTPNTTYSNSTQSVAGLMSANDKKKLDGVATGAEVNQNAFSTVKAGGVSVAANSKTAQVEIVAGNNITISADNSTKKVTINAAAGEPSVISDADIDALFA